MQQKKRAFYILYHFYYTTVTLNIFNYSILLF